MGRGRLRVGGDHAPEAPCSRWFRSDSECPCTNCRQGRYGIPIPEIGRILTLRGTTTLAPAHDPDSCHAPHLINLKTGYDILLNNHNCKVQEMYTVQDHPPSPNESLLLPPLESLYKTHMRNQELPQPGDSRPLCHRLKTQFLSR